jgi:predicted RNA-binding protein with PUA-like domain
MAYWLMKSEPDVFSFDDLVAKTKRGEVEQWHGVRNYTARNNMVAMQLGDLAFFYHSNIGKEIVGIMKVVALAHPDTTAEPNDNGKIVWQCVDVEAVKPLPKPVTLATIKATPELAELELVKYSRLSVSKVGEAEWNLICKMGGL